MGKKRNPGKELPELRESIREQIDRWIHLRKNGGSDPFWPDGCNMNLVRNHIIYAKYQIMKLCEDNGMRVPDEYYLPTPPEVRDSFMANFKQKKRVERLTCGGFILTGKAPKYDPDQMSLM